MVSGDDSASFNASFLARSASALALMRSNEEASISCFCHLVNDLEWRSFGTKAPSLELLPKDDNRRR